MDRIFKKIKQHLAAVKGRRLSDEERVEQAIALTSLLIEASIQQKTASDRQEEIWMAKMMEDPQGRAFMTVMTDESFRSRSYKRVADQLTFLLKKFGIPRFLKESDRFKFLILQLFGKQFPHFFIPMVGRQIRRETARVLLPEDQKAQQAYLQRARQERIRINLNHLGEAILGEEEAQKRLKIYLKDLENPYIDYISVKISTIYSQINAIGYHESLKILASRLSLLYQAAQKHPFKDLNGREVPKFVNLDMEEYRDLDLTIDLFQTLLDREEFFNLEAGIVLQSYLPNSFYYLKKLTQWAQERVKKGGSPIKIRLVKGANLAMERVESSIRGWELATYERKVETDANFKKMLEFCTLYERAQAVHIGVGSHNLFDIALAFILRAEHNSEDFISFEMLEGMALPMQRVVKKIAGSILLYCPEAKEKDFHTAVAYLIRRLDENSGPENFLRHFYKMTPNNLAFKEQAEAFSYAYKQRERVSDQPKRTQNRLLEPKKPEEHSSFRNEPDTDFSLHSNRQWAATIFDKWQSKKHENIPLMIDGEAIIFNLEKGIDPSNPQHTPYFYSQADISLVERAIQTAKAFEKEWENLSFDERYKLMGDVAHQFRKNRADLIGTMMTDGGKTIWEADPEVSEAIDFIEYYRRNWAEWTSIGHTRWESKGTILITPPWNFPCSIPVGGIAAALMTGNCVLFKPAPEAILVGYQLAQLFWGAGIPKKALQLIHCPDDPVGSYLVKDERISSVILTGGTQTAQTFLKLRPGLDLHAEAGGKNGIIVTAMSDRDLAVRDIIHSAFSHSGQKCSACSLLILEKEVYDDPQFKKQLLDATQSLTVASAWNPSAKITPLIRPPEGPLLRGLTTLEEGESWLLQPKQNADNPHLWSPGIKWGVQKNSFTHLNELFGPVLAVMEASTLEEAIEIVNATPYGLTSGLHSLDQREQAYWKEKIVAGNLYINRTITGAIVQRQPFGGCKKSSFGQGAKAGGPHYLTQLAHAHSIELPLERAPLPALLAPLISQLDRFRLTPEEEEIWKRSTENYAYWIIRLKEPKDPSQLLGQNNFFYLVPRDKCYLRLEQKPLTLLPLLQVAAACLICQTPLEISTPFPLDLPLLPITVESEETFLAKTPRQIRLLTPSSSTLKEGAAQIGATLHDNPPLPYGRLELLHYLREISLSIDSHRYGFIL